MVFFWGTILSLSKEFILSYYWWSWYKHYIYFQSELTSQQKDSLFNENADTTLLTSASNTCEARESSENLCIGIMLPFHIPKERTYFFWFTTCIFFKTLNFQRKVRKQHDICSLGLYKSFQCIRIAIKEASVDMNGHSN